MFSSLGDKILEFRTRARERNASVDASNQMDVLSASDEAFPEVPADQIVNALLDIPNAPRPDPTLFIVEPRKGARNLRALRITGQLDLREARLNFPLHLTEDLVLNGCVFDEPILVDGARIAALDLRAAQIPGVRGRRLQVDGDVDLSFAEIGSEERVARVDLHGSRIAGDLLLRGATLNNGKAIALRASAATIDGDVVLDSADGLRFESKGAISFFGSTILGDLVLDGALIEAAVERLPGGRIPTSASFRRSEIGGFVHIEEAEHLRFEARGRVDFSSSHIKGAVSIEGVKISNTSGDAIAFSGSRIDGGLVCRTGATHRCAIEGQFACVDARVAGQLVLEGVQLSSSGKDHWALMLQGAAVGSDVFFARDGNGHGVEIQGDTSMWGLSVAGGLRLSSAVFHGDVVAESLKVGKSTVIAGATRFHGVLNLRNAQLNDLTDWERCWPDPGRLDVDGLVYSRLGNSEVGPDTSSATRLKWLKRQRTTAGFFLDPIPSQPYVQLARVLEGMGQREGAQRVLNALQTHLLWHDVLHVLYPVPWLIVSIFLAVAGFKTVAQVLFNVVLYLSVFYLSLVAIAAGMQFAGKRLRRSSWASFGRRLGVAITDVPLMFGGFRWVGRAFLWLTAGHGYYPLRSAVWFLLLWWIGSLAFEFAHLRGLVYPVPTLVTQLPNGVANLRPSEDASRPAGYPEFSSAVFSANVMLPFIDMRQLSYWEPLAKEDVATCGPSFAKSNAQCTQPSFSSLGSHWLFSRRHHYDERLIPLPRSFSEWMAQLMRWATETIDVRSFPIREDLRHWIELRLDSGGARQWLLIQMSLGALLSVIVAAGTTGLLTPSRQ